MNRKIYAIGETVLDLMFMNEEPKAAKPGGSSLNSAVSLGRLKLPVYLISEWGQDQAGKLIENFLVSNQVNVNHVYRYSGGKSSLAMAFLNEEGKASYDFYKIYPEKRFQIDFPEINKDDIVLFGSFYAISPDIYPHVSSFVKHARKNEAFIIYDPNFRKPHLDDLPKVKHFIEKNISYAHIVKGSNEDFELIFGCRDGKEAFERIQQYGCSYLIYTTGSEGAEFYSQNGSLSLPAGNDKIVSTIGAGDNFSAGMIYTLYKNQITTGTFHEMGINQWTEVLQSGTDFASHVCSFYENYISMDFAKVYW